MKSIQILEEEKQTLVDNNKVMVDDKRASQRLKDELLLSQEKEIEIIKFVDEDWEGYKTYGKKKPHLHGEKIFTIVAWILQFTFFIFFFYKRFYRDFKQKNQNYGD